MLTYQVLMGGMLTGAYDPDGEAPQDSHMASRHAERAKATYWNDTVFKMAKKLGKPVGMFNYSDYGVDIYSNGIIAHEDTIKNKPNRTRRFVIASLEAFNWSVKNPAKAVGSFIKKNPTVSRDVARGHFDVGIDVLLTKNTKRTGIGFMLREKMQNTIDTMYKYKKMKRKPSVDEIYTNDFVGVFPVRGM